MKLLDFDILLLPFSMKIVEMWNDIVYSFQNIIDWFVNKCGFFENENKKELHIIGEVGKEIVIEMRDIGLSMDDAKNGFERLSMALSCPYYGYQKEDGYIIASYEHSSVKDLLIPGDYWYDYALSVIERVEEDLKDENWQPIETMEEKKFDYYCGYCQNFFIADSNGGCVACGGRADLRIKI